MEITILTGGLSEREVSIRSGKAVKKALLRLGHNIKVLDKYSFPDITLEPNSYFIVWADDDEEEQGDYNHATFNLLASGEQLYLSDSDFNILDEVIFGEQIADMGYARVPNGTGDFIIQIPTFNYNNNNITSSSELELKDSEVVKTIDLLGREVNNVNGLMINIYNNGLFEKLYIIE